MYWLLVVVVGNVFLSELHYVLSAECLLGYGVEVARGAEVLGSSGCLSRGSMGRDCRVLCVNCDLIQRSTYNSRVWLARKACAGCREVMGHAQGW